jgi:hypothetical protein
MAPLLGEPPLFDKQQGGLLDSKYHDVVTQIPIPELFRHIFRNVARCTLEGLKDACEAIASLRASHPGESMEVRNIGNEQVRLLTSAPRTRVAVRN